jgi:hypothetical protein
MAAFIMPFVAWQMDPIWQPAWRPTWCTEWRVASLVHLAAVLAVLAPIYRWSGNRVALALLFPLTGLIQLTFFANALWWCITKRMEWRGTVYTGVNTQPAPEAPVSAPKPSQAEPSRIVR